MTIAAVKLLYQPEEYMKISLGLCMDKHSDGTLLEMVTIF